MAKKFQRIKSEFSENLKKALEIDRLQVKIGWLGGNNYPNGMPVAHVAAINEFGYPAKNIPPRPFMRPTLEAKRKEWMALAEKGIRAMMIGNVTPYQVMDRMGQGAAGEFRKAIAEVESPALKPATIKARLKKRSDGKTIGNLTKPLVETGIMLNSLLYEVVEK